MVEVGEEAYKLYKGKNPDIIITDIKIVKSRYKFHNIRDFIQNHICVESYDLWIQK